MRFDAEWAVWPFIVVTSLLQLLYFALLATAYRKAELSFVYPVARGVAPAIVLVVSVVALGHGTSVAQVAGVVLVGAGVLLVRGLRRPADPHALAFALGDRLCDRLLHAARQARDHTREPDHVPRAEHGPGRARIRRRAALVVKGGARVRAELAPRPSLAGIASFAAYALVLAALERASAASVAAVRETSVVMATVFAAVVLHEQVSRWRAIGSVLVVAGIALLGRCVRASRSRRPRGRCRA